MIELKGQIGKYKIVKKLGSGGFGTVYLAEDTILKTYRALKIPHRSNNQQEQLLEESIVQTKLLNHPHIVKLLTVDIIDGNLIMVMEYIKGTDIEKILDKQSKLEIPTALKYFKQILSALDFAHKLKIIHRDIRPSNVLIDETDTIKITDFGTSTLLQQKQFATTKIGSPPYMAPEQFEGRAVLASDLYSVGCLFYEMLSGLPPIVVANPMEIYKRAKVGDFIPLNKKNLSVTPELNSIISRALCADLSKRYPTAGEILADLERLNQIRQNDNQEMANIKERIIARSRRTDYVCWKCRKAMTKKMKTCLYCGTEQ